VRRGAAREVEMKYLFLVGRALFVYSFIKSGLTSHWTPMAVGYARAAGVPLPQLLVPASGVLAAVGGLMLLIGFKPKIGAWLLLAFLVPVTLTMHRFWGLSDPQMAMSQQGNFIKNAAMAGATLMFQFIDRWPLSIKP
jgi:putative oxidoreductase